jgi:hypothetical protein
MARYLTHACDAAAIVPFWCIGVADGAAPPLIVPLRHFSRSTNDGEPRQLRETRIRQIALSPCSVDREDPNDMAASGTSYRSPPSRDVPLARWRYGTRCYQGFYKRPFGDDGDRAPDC